MIKLSAFFILCSICMALTVSASGSAYAHEEIQTHFSAGGGGGVGPEIGIICKFIGQACGSWGICKIPEGIWSCVFDDQDPEQQPQTEM